MKKLLIIFAAAAALVACNKAETPGNNAEAQAVRFTVQNLGTYAFKSPTVALGESGNSHVAIYAADLGANHVEYEVSGSTLIPVSEGSTIKWGVGQTSSSTFAARYPYASVDISSEYGIPYDQSEEDPYTYQVNLMTAVATASPSTAGGVSFNFKHPFSQVVINVTNNLGGDAIASVKLTGMNCKATTFNVGVENPVTELSADAADTKDMIARPFGVEDSTKPTVYTFRVIVLPQTATPSIVVTTTLGSEYTFNLSSAYTFVAGTTATTDVELEAIGGSTGGGSQSSVAIGFVQTNWAVAGTNPATNDPTSKLGNYWHVVGCVYDDAHKNITTTPAWQYDYPMALGSDGKWSITINYDEAMSSTGKGFKLRRFTDGVNGDARWGTQFGFQTTTADDWTLASGATYENLSGAASSKNIRLASQGQWTIVLDDDDLTATRVGDVTSAIE